MKSFKKMELKLGRFTIRHLTRYIITAYVIGYILAFISMYSSFNIQLWISLNPGLIMKGQIWRLFSWVFIPPSSFSIFTVIMLFFYYQIGTVLEKVWGDFVYNWFIYFGLIATVAGAFIMYFAGGAYYIDITGGLTFSTYYVSLSVFFGFAMTFPEERINLFFVFPVKIKYLAIVDAAYLTYVLIMSSWLIKIQIICSLAGVIIFFIITRKHKISDRRRRREFARKTSERGGASYRVVEKKTAKVEPREGAPRHRCHVCGRTELDDPNLEFRYCSKCNGNYEYCSDHLFSHKHIE